VLTDSSVSLAGSAVARDPRQGVELVRVRGPLTVLTKVTGLYPGDTWSGRRVTYTRVQCGGGRLSVLLGSDPSLFRLVQVVVAREGGAVVGRGYVTPDGQASLRLRLHPTAAGRCVVRFDVARTAVPARVLPGSADNRVLGAHFLRFDFHR
jgi:hypothetical protein